MRVVYCVNWTEYERGWGQRPDGHTLHASKAIADDYLKEFFGRRQAGPVPDEYTQPGEPFAVEVDFETYDKVKKVGSLWGHHSQNRS